MSTTRSRDVKLQEGTFIPRALLPIERTREIFDMLDAGLSLEEIYEDQYQYHKVVYGRSASHSYAQARVDTVLLNKWRYCPDIDEVAVERAYDGDKAVWEALTHYERQIVLDRLYETWNTKPHRKWPEDEHGNGIASWARSVGEKHERVSGLRRGVNGQRRRRA